MKTNILAILCVGLLHSLALFSQDLSTEAKETLNRYKTEFCELLGKRNEPSFLVAGDFKTPENARICVQAGASLLFAEIMKIGKQRQLNVCNTTIDATLAAETKVKAASIFRRLVCDPALANSWGYEKVVVCLNFNEVFQGWDKVDGKPTKLINFNAHSESQE
jgi:hypothetical protein